MASSGAMDDLQYRRAGRSCAGSINAPDYTATRLQNIAASSLFSVSDRDAGDTIKAYDLWDTTTDVGSGSWLVYGGAQAPGHLFEITPADLLHTTFQSGSVQSVDGECR